MFTVATYERIRFFKFLKLTFSFFLLFAISSTSLWMFENRPLQNIYFNQFAGKDIKENWLMDYWGLSNRKALEYIVTRDNSSNIKVASGSDMELWRSIKLLNLKDQARISYVANIESANYIITNYRGSKVFDDSNFPSNFRVEHRFWVGNANVATILRKIQ